MKIVLVGVLVVMVMVMVGKGIREGVGPKWKTWVEMREGEER